MNGETLLEAILPAWRAGLPAFVDHAYFESYLARNRATVVTLLDEWLTRRRARQATVAAAEAVPDELTAARRARANLAAMTIAASGRPAADLSDEERQTLLKYSGWGGLSIEKYLGEFPPGWTPEIAGLIHEYYTPTAIAEQIADQLCPLLQSAAGVGGELLALEPSAGIGRFINALDRATCDPEPKPAIRWLAVEASLVSSRLLALTRPDVDLTVGTFEKWIAERGPDLQGRLGLVLANPPYGERGPGVDDDPDPDYAERQASAYFLRRGLDLLAPGGLGVYLIPGGFLTGVTGLRLRERVLRRHHLAAAYRLPSRIFPGTSELLVIDLLIFRARGGELSEVDESDRFILDGRYFEEFPAHDLSGQQGRFALPPLVERPLCTACVVRPIAWKRARAVGPRTGVARERAEGEDKLPDAVRSALSLGRRVRRYRAAIAAGDPEADAQHPELLADLQAMPRETATLNAVRSLARAGDLAAEAFVAAYTPRGEPDLPAPPPARARYSGLPQDVVAQAEALYKDRRRLRIDDLLDFHRARGGALDRPAALQALFDAGWNLDGDNFENLVPEADYITGDLWPRYDRVLARSADDPQIERQRQRLRQAMRLATFEDIQSISPRQGWVPIALVAEWLGALYNAGDPVDLVRRGGLVTIAGSAYARVENSVPRAEVLWALGYLNHDAIYFRPAGDPPPLPGPLPPGSNAITTSFDEPTTRDVDDGDADSADDDDSEKTSRDELRRRWILFWEASFYAWLAREPARRDIIAEAYNRAMRGYVPRTYATEPLPIARWGADIILEPHQVAGARRVLEQRGGLVAFDVGVGKTFTAIAIVGRARQEGWARRPVVLVPGSLVWKWKRDFERCLPDYRVAVIGSERTRLTRGKRYRDVQALLKAGQITDADAERMLLSSRTDTPDERAAKWRDFQAGAYDVAILSFDALGRTRIGEDTVERHLRRTDQVMRSIELTLRSTADKPEKKLTERQKAIRQLGLRGWIQDKLRAPKTWTPDPGILWEDLGIDLLVVDEAAAFKNLYLPEKREGGAVRYMGGSGGEGSKRAWSFEFRAAVVRERTGGAGVVLLSATPAKNSPVEFYNIVQYIDHAAWRDRGIHDPEHFIDRYCKIDLKPVVTANFDVEVRPAVVGFTNLDELRAIIFRYGEFRTAREVGIKLPQPRIHRVEVALDPKQRAKYDEFVAQVEAALKKGKATSVLGFLARLALVAVHGDLDEGYDYQTAFGGRALRQVSLRALPYYVERGWKKVQAQPGAAPGRDAITVVRELAAPDPQSPKFEAIAQRIAAQRSCGHIVFCEPTAAHQWLRRVLVDRGIPEERIAVLNADATTPADRVRIAQEFNGDEEQGIEPLYDVVIANSVAYEGVDLQVRTCAIHHADLPWTPADLEQRNGRGFRQGNTLGVIEIYYYLARGSMDLFRFDLIDGKAGWMSDLIAGNRDTNNPAAQEDMSPEEILIALSGDPQRTRAVLEERRRREAEAKRQAARVDANRLLRRASARFQAARDTLDMERAATWRAEAEEILRQLDRVDPEIWPWAAVMYAARDVPLVFTAPDGAPLWEGLRLALEDSTTGDVDFVEIGRALDESGEGEDAAAVATRRAGGARWESTYLSTLALAVTPQSYPAATAHVWPADDEPRALAEAAELAARDPLQRLVRDHLRGASDPFLRRLWPALAPALTASAARSTLPVPLVDNDALVLAAGADVTAPGRVILPWTLEGYQRYLSLAPASGRTFTDLADVARFWWSRRLPRDLLSRARRAASTNDAAPEPDDEAPPGSTLTAPALTAGAKARLAAAQEAELQSIRRIAGDDRGLFALARELAELAAPLEKTPRQIERWFAAQDLDRIADAIDTYLARPGPLEPFLKDLADELRVTNDDDDSVEDGGDAGLIVPDAIRSSDRGLYVLREDPEGLSARYIELRGPVLDDDGEDTSASYVRDPDLAESEGPQLAARDRLINPYDPSIPDEATLRERWRHFQLLAQALRRAPEALERTRHLLVYAAELVRAPKCEGEARTAALRSLRLAIKEHQRAADAINQDLGQAAERLGRVARYLARSAHAVAESCAAGQRLLIAPELVTPRDIDPAADIPTPAEEALDAPDA